MSQAPPSPHPDDLAFQVRYRQHRPISRAWESVWFASEDAEIVPLACWCADIALRWVEVLKQACLLARDPRRSVNTPHRNHFWEKNISPMGARLDGPPPHMLMRFAGDYGGRLPEDRKAGLRDALGALAHLARLRLVVVGPNGLTSLLGPRLEALLYHRDLVLPEGVVAGTPLLLDPADGRFVSLAPLVVWQKAPHEPFGHLLVLQRVDGTQAHYVEDGVPGCPGAVLPLAGRPVEGTWALPAPLESGVRAPPVRFPDGMEVGPYHIEGVIWRGGMSDVFLARRLKDGRPVALKTHEDEPGVFDENYRRFLNEERFAAPIVHARVVRPLGVKVGALGLVHEQAYVAGGSLQDLLDTHGVLPASHALRLADEVLDALGAIHAAGVAHNDVKPDNILFDEGGSAHIIDFGIAHELRLSARALRPGVPAGSRGYMAPERFEGKPPSAASDLYALGVVLAQLLSGDLPQSPAEVRATPGIPGPVRWFLDRCLQSDPRQRYPSAAAARQDLARVRRAVVPTRAISLDIEGTLVTNYSERVPRPGLQVFLRFCLDWFDRIFIYTLLTGAEAREVFEHLHGLGIASDEFLQRYEYVEWPRGANGTNKDLRRCQVPLLHNAIVDDTPEVVPADQHHRWVQVPDFNDPERPDQGLWDAIDLVQRRFGFVG